MEQKETPKTDWLNEEPLKEIDFDAISNKICRYVWAGLGIICLAGAMCAGAWWHLGTAAICGVMWLAIKAEQPKKENGK